MFNQFWVVYKVYKPLYSVLLV